MAYIKKGRRKGKTAATKALADEVRRLKVEGFSYAEISSKIGFTRQYAQLLIRLPGNRSGICGRCGGEFKSLHGHHTSYEADAGKFLCVRCHPLEEHATDSLIRKVKTSAVEGGLSFDTVADWRISRVRFKSICRMAGIRPVFKTRMHPRWEAMNWNLPNIVLADVWGIRFQKISNVRSKLGKPKGGFWRLLIGRGCSVGDIKELQPLIALEKKKVAQFSAQ